MSIDAIVRVSWQKDKSSTAIRQAVNRALVGHPQDTAADGPFTRIGTAAFSASDRPDAAVSGALVELSKLLKENVDHLDFASITIARRTASPPIPDIFEQ